MNPFMSILKILVVSAFAVSSLSAAGPIDLKKYKEPVRVACIGDSITQGTGTKGNPYPAQLQAMLGDKWNVGNFGVSGRTLLRKGDYPYWNEKAYQDALAFKPDVVIIMLGTNDTKPQNWAHEAEFVMDYRDLVKSFLDLESKPQVFICRPCPVIGNGSFNIVEENIQKEIPRIDALAKEMNLGVIDMHAALKDNPEMIPDKVHPNAAGAGEMAKAAFKALTGKKAPKAAKK
jgi:lysophospholipase L1-like esterase